MKRAILVVVGLVLFSLSVLGVDVSVQQTDLGRGEVVEASVSGCEGDSTLKITNPAVPPDLVYVDQGSGEWESRYNTNSNAFRGRYAIYVRCADGTAAQAEFCVEAPGCLGGVVQGPPGGEDGGGDAGDGGSPGGGGGRYCNPKWECDNYWTVCNNDLVQNKNCFDANNCEQPKVESRECQPCRESWTCSMWGECVDGVESRTCYDDLDCGSAEFKPEETRECGAEYVSGPEPAKYSTQIPPPKGKSVKQVGPVKESKVEAVKESFWDVWGLLVLAVIALLMLAGVIMLVLHFRHGRQVAYNSNELKEWIVKERAAGTSDADIRQILMEQTGWTKEDVDTTFSEISKEGAVVLSSGPAARADGGVKEGGAQGGSGSGEPTQSQKGEGSASAALGGQNAAQSRDVKK